MLWEAGRALEGETSLEKIYFVLVDDAAREVFEKKLKEMRAEH